MQIIVELQIIVEVPDSDEGIEDIFETAEYLLEQKLKAPEFALDIHDMYLV